MRSSRDLRCARSAEGRSSRGDSVVDGAANTLLRYAYSGSRGVYADATALVLAGSRPSVSAPSDDRTDPSPMRGVRACGENQGHEESQRLRLCLRTATQPMGSWVPL